MATKPKVLLIAESANPEFTSVPLVGWSMAESLLRATDAHLVTQVRNAEAIARSGLVSADQYTTIDSEFVAKKVYALNKVLRRIGFGWTATTALASISYYAFERLAWKKFANALRSGEYDIVHRITPLSPTVASPYFAKKCAALGIPFVLGPLNGGVPWPKGYDAVRRKEGEWLSYIRRLYKLMPGYQATRKHAKAIITGSWATRDQLPASVDKKCVYIVENAIDPTRFRACAPRALSKPIRAAFIGRLVPYKGADIVIEAGAPFLRSGELTLDVFGDGQEMKAIEAQCSELGVCDAVRLHGWVNHTELHKSLYECNILSFPSIREFGGGVVLEAMAMGLVPIVANYAGPGELVSDETGFRLPISNRDGLVESLREVLESVIHNPEQLIPMRQAGLDKIEQHFTWDKKAQKVLDVYRWVLGDTEINPELVDGFLSSQRDTPTH